MDFSRNNIFDTEPRLNQELSVLSAMRLREGVLVSFLLVSLTALMCHENFHQSMLLTVAALIIAIILGRFLQVSRLVRDFTPDDNECRTRLDSLSLISAISDGVFWWLIGWILLANGMIDINFYMAISVAAAVTYGYIYLFNPRSALAVSGIILLSSVPLSLVYGNSIAYQSASFVLAFSLALGFAVYRQRRLLINQTDACIRSEHLAQRANEANFVFNQHWQNTPLAAIEWDQRFRICSWNPSAETIFGFSAEEALGQPLNLIFHGEDLDKTKKKWRALWRNRKGFRSIHTCINKDGHEVNCEWHDAAIMRNGQAIGIASFVEDITSQVKAEAIIKQQANFDSLTGLPNRRRMMQEITRSISRSKRSREYAALVFLDLDHFKDINDTQGHDVGDIVLSAFARRVSELVRTNDMVARFGGDEFVVLFENLGMSQGEAARNLEGITQKILHAGQGLCKVGDVEHDLDVSGGVVLFDGHWEENDILKKADLAMYRVKNEGRKGISFYDDSLSIETEYRVELIRGLRRGLENKEFDLHFQPILDRSGDIIYTEALLRWMRQPNKAVAAGSFIDILSQSPIMSSVGYWIIDRVSQGINQLIQEGLWDETRAIFVNVSPRQLMDERFTEKVMAILQENRIDPTWIVFEITEDSLIQNYDEVCEQLRYLVDTGIRIALDDFGTGYSSLAMLKNLPVHFVKLDREFINSLLDNDNNYQIVSAITKLCEVLDLKVIAEGIEERKQFIALKKLHCDYFQGYMFHKPMPLALLVDELSDKSPGDFGGKFKVEHLCLVE